LPMQVSLHTMIFPQCTQGQFTLFKVKFALRVKLSSIVKFASQVKLPLAVMVVFFQPVITKLSFTENGVFNFTVNRVNNFTIHCKCNEQLHC